MSTRTSTRTTKSRFPKSLSPKRDSLVRGRPVLLKASDPYALLFADLPRACGISQDIREHAPKQVVDALVSRLREAATELRNAYDLMLIALSGQGSSAHVGSSRRRS